MQNGKHLELSIKTLAATILLGLLGNLLLRDVPWGIGFTGYIFAIVGVCAYLYRGGLAPVSRSVAMLLPPILLFASTFAWRDSSSLKFLNAIALMLLIGLAVMRRHQDSLSVGTVVDYPFRLFGRWFQFVGDAVPLFNLEGRWPQLAKVGGMKQVAAVMRGLLIAIPLILLFGGLFISADAAFERLVTNSFQLDSEAIASNLVVTAACAWLVGGFLRRMFLVVSDEVLTIPPIQSKPQVQFAEKAEPTQIGLVEVGTVLGLLNLLFATFVGTQIPYFFGGSNLVQQTAGLGYADYARRGFFELGAVAALALPVLLGSHALLTKSGASGPKLFKVMAGVLVGLLFVVIASAGYRMQLYVEVYGISMLRIYVLAIIGWLSTVFGWFVLTVLRDRPQRFAFGGLVLFLAAVLTLNIINPEALTARINTTRVASTTVDTSYLNSLSADATPELVKAVDRLKGEARQHLLDGLDRKSKQLQHGNWRSWSLSLHEAAAALRQRH
ncbi:MAG: DUF4153 domain-containing protein [Fimbriimonas sp.]